ncbi:MAG: PKD domain-containing protein [Bacteroidota bacterium]
MKKINLFFIMPIFMVLSGCDKDSDNQPMIPPVASFETEKQYYDDGEVIQFINTSENASSYLWNFGGVTTSTEENPTYSAQLHDFLGNRFSVSLKAFAEDGSSDSIIKYFAISKRILHDIEIVDMSDEIRNRIPWSEITNTELVVYMGPVNDPLEWIVPGQTIPPSIISKDFELPFRYNLMTSWPRIGMNNTDWILRISAQLEGNTETRIMLKEFYFNPAKIQFLDKDEYIKHFVLSEEDLSLKVYFYYIKI